MPHNLAHLLYELRRKAGHNDFDSEESVTIIRQIVADLKLNNLIVQTQARGEQFSAAEFTASNSEQLEVADNAVLSVSDAIDWSIAGFFRSKDSVSFQNLIGHRITGQLGWSLHQDTLNQLNWTVGDQVRLISNPKIVDDTWTFFAGWFNSGTTRFGVRINAGDDGEIAYTGTLTDNTAKFMLGNFDGSTDFFNGDLARWGLWKKVLSATEITSLFNLGSGLLHSELTGSLLTSLQAYWNLDETSGQRNDSEGTNHLTDINTVTSLVKGTYYVGQADVRRNFCLNPSFEHDLTGWTETNTADGKSAQFTAANTESLSIADNPTLSTGNIDFTMVGWVYLDSIGADRVFPSKWTDSGNNREYRLIYDHSELRFRFTVSATGTSGSAAFVDADNLGAPAINTWYFIAAWHDAINDTINIQVDDGTVDSVAHTAGLTDLTSLFRIGAFGASPTSPHDGRIVSIGFWKRILATRELTFLYNSGNGKPYEALGLFDDGELLQDKLISYWNLSEVSGVRNDSHGSNNLTDNNTVTQGIGLTDFAANGRDDTQKNTGEASLKLAMVNSSASAEIVSRAFVITGLSATEIWSVSASVRIESLTLAKFTLRIEFLNASDVSGATHNVDSTTVSTSFATVVNENRTVPATAVKIRVTLILQSTASLGFGVIHCDSIIVEKASSIGDYFDGDSQNCFWEISPHNGESFNDVDGTATIAGYFKVSA